MTRKSAARRRPAVKAAPRSDAVQADASTNMDGGFMTLLEKATQEILAVTYWFDPVPHSKPYPVTVRFSGRRIDVRGRISSRDRFAQDERIEQVVPGSGPIAVTARVSGINPGEWVVTASIVEPAHLARELKEQENAPSEARWLRPAAWLWRRWAPSVESADHVKTCLTPFAHAPGILPGIWGTMATLGIVVALALQFLVVSADHLALGPWWVVSLVAIVAGIAGAKVWFIVLYRREHRLEGWCIQGFITGAIVTAAILLLVFHIPAGVFLDMITPGLLIAMSIGRIGCFFAGCCGGPLTASHWGVWSSDQRVGARRIPTQLLESLLALSLGLGTLAAIVGRGPAGGAYFAAGLAAYTLVRQGILHLRAEPRKTKYGGLITAVLATLVLVAAIVFLAR